MTADIDRNSAQLIRRVLELMEEDQAGFSEQVGDKTKLNEKPARSPRPDPEAVLATMPADVRASMDARDMQALKAVLAEMPHDEALEIIQQLSEAGIIE